MLLLFFFSHCNKNSFVIVPSRFLCYNALVLNYLYPHLLELSPQGCIFLLLGFSLSGMSQVLFLANKLPSSYLTLDYVSRYFYSEYQSTHQFLSESAFHQLSIIFFSFHFIVNLSSIQSIALCPIFVLDKIKQMIILTVTYKLNTIAVAIYAPFLKSEAFIKITLLDFPCNR